MPFWIDGSHKMMNDDERSLWPSIPKYPWGHHQTLELSDGTTVTLADFPALVPLPATSASAPEIRISCVVFVNDLGLKRVQTAY